MKNIYLLSISLLFMLAPVTLLAQLSDDWTFLFNGKGDGEDNLTAMEVDADGNTILFGETDTGFLDPATTVFKLDADGNVLWQVFPETDGKSLQPVALYVDGNYIYLTGTYDSPGGYSDDIFLIKLAPDGTQVWTSYYQSVGNKFDDAMGMAMDNSGNLIVFGNTEGANNDIDLLVVKYDTTGKETWHSAFNNPKNNFPDEANAIAVDDDDNLYVCGKNHNAGVSGNDFLTVKFSASGKMVWYKIFDDSLHRDDVCNAILVDHKGDIVVTGASNDNGPGYPVEKITTIKYDSSGNEKWVARFRASNSTAVPSKIVMDANNNLYVAGNGYWDDTKFDVVLIKYNEAGKEQWYRRIDDGNFFDDGYDLLYSTEGYLYVAGYLEDENRLASAFVKVFNTSGDSLTQVGWTDPNDENSSFSFIRFDPSGNLIAGGTLEKLNDNDMLVVKYSGAVPVGIKEPDDERIAVYPNPAHEQCIITWPRQSEGMASVELRDMTGKVCYSTIATAEGNNGSVAISTMAVPSGIYILTIKTTDHAYVNKQFIVH